MLYTNEFIWRARWLTGSADAARSSGFINPRSKAPARVKSRWYIYRGIRPRERARAVVKPLAAACREGLGVPEKFGLINRTRPELLGNRFAIPNDCSFTCGGARLVFSLCLHKESVNFFFTECKFFLYIFITYSISKINLFGAILFDNGYVLVDHE